MSSQSTELDTSEQKQGASDHFAMLIPILILLVSGAITAAWVGFLVWVPLHLLELM